MSNKPIPGPLLQEWLDAMQILRQQRDQGLLSDTEYQRQVIVLSKRHSVRKEQANA